jgi:hypothetical protein
MIILEIDVRSALAFDIEDPSSRATATRSRLSRRRNPQASIASLCSRRRIAADRRPAIAALGFASRDAERKRSLGPLFVSNATWKLHAAPARRSHGEAAEAKRRSGAAA